MKMKCDDVGERDDSSTPSCPPPDPLVPVMGVFVLHIRRGCWAEPPLTGLPCELPSALGEGSLTAVLLSLLLYPWFI